MANKHTRHRGIAKLGGYARARNMSPEQRSLSATKAVQARWARSKAKASGVPYVPALMGLKPAPVKADAPPIVAVKLSVWREPKKKKNQQEPAALDTIPNIEINRSEASTKLTPTAPSQAGKTSQQPKSMRDLANNPPNLNI